MSLSPEQVRMFVELVRATVLGHQLALSKHVVQGEDPCHADQQLHDSVDDDVFILVRRIIQHTFEAVQQFGNLENKMV